MKRATMIATGVSVVVVAGLAALSAPAIGSVAGALVPGVATAAEAAAPSEPTPSPPELPDDSLPGGYVYLGDGISRPAGGPGDCDTSAFINITGNWEFEAHGKLLGELIDMGARPGASGAVLKDADGVRAYIVESGDALISIGERFCVDYQTVSLYNNVVAGGNDIQPGQELILRPDPNVPWVPFWADQEG